MSLTVGSLFSGIGGLELGLEWAGLVLRWQVEVEPYASAILEWRWPHVTRYGDIIKVAWGAVEPVDVVCGGFPCQDISSAGRRAGILAGGKSGLWREFTRCLAAVRPRYAVIENVAGLLSGFDDVPACRCGAAGRDYLTGDLDAATLARCGRDAGIVCASCGRDLDDGAAEPVRHSWMGRVLGDLAALGYDAEWECLPAAAFGAPHLRYRTFIVAHRHGDRRRTNQGDSMLAGDAGDLRFVGLPGEADGGPSHIPDADGERGREERTHAGDGLGRRATNDAGPVRSAVADAAGAGRLDIPGGDGGGAESGRAPGYAEPRSAAGGILRLAAIEQWPEWAAEPDVGRVADGVPDRVDRLRCLGNAVVPQCAEWIGRCLVRHAELVADAARRRHRESAVEDEGTGRREQLLNDAKQRGARDEKPGEWTD